MHNGVQTLFKVYVERTFGVDIQSNLAIRNFLVALKLFLNAKSSLSFLFCFEVVYFSSDIHTTILVINVYNTLFMSRTDGASSSHFLRALLADTILEVVF